MIFEMKKHFKNIFRKFDFSHTTDLDHVVKDTALYKKICTGLIIQYIGSGKIRVKDKYSLTF